MFYTLIPSKRINDIVPNAMYVHCCAHNLNLVLCDAAKSSDKAMKYFETVQSVFNFFGGSAPKWALLALAEDNATAVRKKVLKRVCTTRWEASILHYLHLKKDLLMC